MNSFPFFNYFKDKTPVNIKFFNGMTIHLNTETKENYGVSINPAAYILSTYYKLNGKNVDRVNFLDTVHNNTGLDEVAIEQIIQSEKPDIICFGLYAWNQKLFTRLGTYIKQKHPHILIITGGPSVSVHTENDKYWTSFPFTDVAVYGEGEKAFTVLVDSLIDSSTAGKLHNIAYGDVVLEFDRFKDDEFTKVSPFLFNKDTITNDVKTIREKYGEDLVVYLNWEFARGCPYKCTFCDWNNGLHNKVTRKVYDWRTDLDFFSELNLTLRWIDANNGIFEDDEDIIKYMVTLKRSNPKFGFLINNYSKVNKERVYQMYLNIVEMYPKMKFSISFQDLNDNVLAAIDRPSISYEEHKKLIKNVINKQPDIRLFAELLIGLPEQTLTSFKNNLIELSNELNIPEIQGAIWVLLPNSPANNQKYFEKYKLKFIPTLYVINFHKFINDRSKILEVNDVENNYIHGNFIFETSTMTYKEIIIAAGMCDFYNKIYKTFKKNVPHLIEKGLNNTEFWEEFGSYNEKLFLNDYERFNQIIWATEYDDTQLSFGEYFGRNKVLLQVLK